MNSYRAELLRAGGRGNVVFLLLCVALSLFSVSNAGPQGHTPLSGFQDASIFIATFLMGRAATVAATDFSGGTIRPWLISSPRRLLVLLGKLAASLTASAVTAGACGVAAYVFSAVLGRVPSLPGIAAAVGELLAASLALTLFGHAVGVLSRSVPAALVITLAWVLPGEKILQGRFPDSGTWLPATVLQGLTTGHVLAGQSLIAALLHGFIPFLLLEGIAVASFLRRDVNE